MSKATQEHGPIEVSVDLVRYSDGIVRIPHTEISGEHLTMGTPVWLRDRTDRVAARRATCLGADYRGEFTFVIITPK